MDPWQKEALRLAEENRELKQRVVDLRKKRDELSWSLTLERERNDRLSVMILDTNEHRQRGGYTGGV